MDNTKQTNRTDVQKFVIPEDILTEFQNGPEMDPDQHDACYELLRETVQVYADIETLDLLDYHDLDLVYLTPIGIWKGGVKKRRSLIEESNLPEEDKGWLLDIWDINWKKTENKEYQHRESGNPCIGMFGSGFYSFKGRVADDTPRLFIKMLIDILPMSDDESMFERCEQLLTKPLKGLGVASVSAILHTLKPMTFPILNGNAGATSIWDGLNLVEKKGDLSCFIDNCRRIKQYRDEHFFVKNYRAYDMAALKIAGIIGPGIDDVGNREEEPSQIDYISVLKYLEENMEVPYSNPDADGIMQEKKEELLEIRQKGQAAVTEMRKMAFSAENLYGLNKCLPIAWLDGSNTKTKKYLWAQMKYADYASNPISISLFVEENGAPEALYRVSLEIKNDAADKDMMTEYQSHLDIPLNVNDGLVYVSGNNKWGRPDELKYDQETIRKKVASGEIGKVQICKFIRQEAGRSNDSYHHEVMSAISSLIPYYRHVLGLDDTKEDVREGTDEYWPSLSDYDPGITKEMWVKILEDHTVTSFETFFMLKRMQELGGEATCSKLEKLYGNSASQYNRWGSGFGQKIATKYGIEPCEDNGRKRYFPIPFLGRHVQEDGTQRYSWRLRDELMEALLEVNDYVEDQPLKIEYDKNMILYGPPGTGKTYHTAIYAVAICTGRTIEDVAKKPYQYVMDEYDRLKKENRIAFTTFHQSYGYEEFIEGIKPIVDENESALGYTIESGVFKKFCEYAKTPSGMEVDSNTQIWFVRLDTDKAHVNKENCYRNDEIRFNCNEERLTDDDSWFQERFIDAMQIGDYILSYAGNSVFVDGIGIIQGEPVFDSSRENYCWIRKVKWLHKGEKIDVREINGNRYLPNFTIAKMNHMKISDLLTLLPHTQIEKKNPYVFIIDEINRGNISKIFGELITLIEDTKREGMMEQASAILPYSGETFSVPENVYILGTMNTADRSIALMDTALRRRFQFVEMMPNVDVLRAINADKVEDLDVAEMLEKINERITFLYDREHTIGHAFFTKLAKTPTLETLQSIFEKSVIPLLQEYFYEDYQKIQLVLGDNAKTNPDMKFVLDEDVKIKSLFKGSAEDLIDLPEKKYTVNKKAFENIESYKQIM